MRHSMQIVSACAVLMVAAGPVTGFSDNALAQDEKLPCNSFCRTWMGYESHAGTGQQAPSTDTVKSPAVVQDAAPPSDNLETNTTSTGSVSEPEGEASPSHTRPKRNARVPETTDASDEGPVAARSKAKKLAKSLKTPETTGGDGLSDSGPTTRRRSMPVDEKVRTTSVDHDANPSEPAHVASRSVPLPPRLPRSLRPSLRDVAQKIAPNASDEDRVRPMDGHVASGALPSTPGRNTGPLLNPGVAAARVAPASQIPHPIQEAPVESAAKPTPNRPEAPATAVSAQAPDPKVVSTGGRDTTPALASGNAAAPVVTPVQIGHVATAAPAENSAKLTSNKPEAPVSAQALDERAASPDGRDLTSSPDLPNAAARVAPPPRVAPAAVAAPAGNTATLIVPDQPKAPTAVLNSAAPPVPDPATAAALVAPSTQVAPAAKAVPADNTAALLVPNQPKPPAPPPVPDSVTAAALVAPPTQVAPIAVAAPAETAAKLPAPSQPKAPVAVVNEGASTPTADPANIAARVATPVQVAPAPDTVPTETAAKLIAPSQPQSPATVVDEEAAVARTESTAARDSTSLLDPGTAAALVAPPTQVAPVAEAASAATAKTLLAPNQSEASAAMLDPHFADPAAPNAASAAGLDLKHDDPPQESERVVAPAGVVRPSSDVAPMLVPAGRDGQPVVATNDDHTADVGSTTGILGKTAVPPDTQIGDASDSQHDAVRPQSLFPNPDKTPNSKEGDVKAVPDESLRASPNETASMSLPVPVPTDGTTSSPITIAIGEVAAKAQDTTIIYTITNSRISPVDLLFVRCNALDYKGVIVGSVFDYVENIPAGEQIKRVVRIASAIGTPQKSFSCANDGTDQ